MSDMVNHPRHYTDTPFGLEVIEITQHYNFCLGNALKYTLRAGKKWDTIEDLKKAVWYLNREIDNREKGVYDGENKQEQKQNVAANWNWSQQDLFKYAYNSDPIVISADEAGRYNQYTVTHNGGTVHIQSSDC